MAPTLLTLLTGLGGRTRPMFNITISNVPGPDKPLYFRGAELMATYPALIVTHGQALSITCQSYAGAMNFGFTGCHSSLPSMQRLAVYAADTLKELESAILPRAKRAKPGRARPAWPGESVPLPTPRPPRPQDAHASEPPRSLPARHADALKRRADFPTKPIESAPPRWRLWCALDHADSLDSGAVLAVRGCCAGFFTGCPWRSYGRASLV